MGFGRTRAGPTAWASCCLLAIVLAPRPSAQQSAAPPPAAISGVVVDAVSGQPLAGAVVTLARLDVRLPAPRAVTDARGRFVFETLPASDGYYLGARRFGYAYTRYGWSGPGQSLAIKDIATISLRPGQWVRDIRIPLWRLGSISGRVVDERGEPVVGVAVRAFSTRLVAGSRQLVAGPIVTTDDRGVYRLADLDPGSYVVSVPSVQSTVLTTTLEAPQVRAVGEITTGGIGAGRGATVSNPGIDVDGKHRLVMTNFATPPPPASAQPRAYPPVFYPAGRAASEAAAIAIDYGDSRSGVDFQLQPVPVARVSGRLDGGDGQVPRLLLRLMARGTEQLGFGSETATTVVEPDGAFTFLNVPEGEYTILAQASVMDFTSGSASVRLPDAPGFPAGGIGVGSVEGVPGLSYLTRNGAASDFWGRTTVAVGGRDVTDVVLPMRRVVQIRGRVVLADGTAPPPRNHVRLSAQPVDGDPSLGWPSGYTSDATLSFTVGGLLGGTYLLEASSFGTVSVVANGKDVTYTGFDASSGRAFDDVVVTVTDKLGEVGGRVADVRSPRGTVAVIVFPVNRTRWTRYGWDPPDFRTVRAASDGSYLVENIPQGEYFVVAVDGSELDAWVDPKWLAQASAQAARLSIKWGEKKTLDLVVR
jgi:hypothetical protein